MCIKASHELKCLFGFHDYTIPDKNDPDILLCKHCKRFGYYNKYSDGYEFWYEYDEKGNIIHRKTSDGYEVWYEYDDVKKEIRCTNNFGQSWFRGEGELTPTKDVKF